MGETNNSVKTQDILMMFIAFDMLSNNRNIPPQIYSSVGQSYQNIKSFLINKGLIDEKDKSPELTLVED